MREQINKVKRFGQFVNESMKKISVVTDFNKAKTGVYNFVLLDGTRRYEFIKWSNSEETLNKERERIIKINPELGNRLIIVKTQIRDFYY